MRTYVKQRMKRENIVRTIIHKKMQRVQLRQCASGSDCFWMCAFMVDDSDFDYCLDFYVISRTHRNIMGNMAEDKEETEE